MWELETGKIKANLNFGLGSIENLVVIQNYIFLLEIETKTKAFDFTLRAFSVNLVNLISLKF